MRIGEGSTTASLEAITHIESIEGVAGLILVYSPLYEQLPSALCLTQAEHHVGREVTGAGDLKIPEAAVSRLHARIQRKPDGIWVEDAGSTNGTIVNGERVTRARLEEHDVVRFGDSVFRFTTHGANDYAAYRPDGTIDEARRKHRPQVRTALVGGHQIDALLVRIEKVARTALTCIVTGESGTGKELLARTIHDTSGRRGTYQVINCAALPENLLESELFGYRKGAFTGATHDKLGLIQAAHGGTLLLDEIGDMPLGAQAKLLRVLQEREVLPIGATRPELVDVRVVCATHRDLELEVAEGRFRGDLLARLREFEARLPKLRARLEDLMPLTKTFLRRAGREDAKLSPSFMLALAHYDWPYNVRELESAVRLAVALADGGALSSEHLPANVCQALREVARTPSPAGAPAARPPIDVAAQTTKGSPSSAPTEAELREACLLHRGNVAAIARYYGKERMQIHRWLKRYDLDIERFRAP